MICLHAAYCTFVYLALHCLYTFMFCWYTNIMTQHLQSVNVFVEIFCG